MTHDDCVLFSDIDPEIIHFSNLYPNFPSNFICEYYDNISKFNALPVKSYHDLAIFHVKFDLYLTKLTIYMPIYNCSNLNLTLYV